jgi:hypothetical protein
MKSRTDVVPTTTDGWLAPTAPVAALATAQDAKRAAITSVVLFLLACLAGVYALVSG